MTLKFKALGNPLLIISDNPSGLGGLARHCRDVAALAATLPEFRVAVLGRGEGNRHRFPFTLYSYPEAGGWGEGFLRGAWEEFSCGEAGVILTLDDASRRLWFAQASAAPPELQEWLGPGRNFLKAGYFPVDSTGPGADGGLSLEGRHALAGYDRVCAASEWGREVLRNSGRSDADWLPHGVWDSFTRVGKAKEILSWTDRIVLGCNMANQARKDWAVAFDCAARLKAEYGNKFLAWFHTDTAIKAWNLWALGMDYGISNCVELTTLANDEQLAIRYSGCDVTILPSGGEGFGFPILESLACGTGCVVTDYAAGQELVEEDARVAPIAWKVETPHNVRRAVLSGAGFARAAQGMIEKARGDEEGRAQELSASVEHLRWDKLRWLWERWLRSLISEGGK